MFLYFLLTLTVFQGIPAAAPWAPPMVPPGYRPLAPMVPPGYRPMVPTGYRPMAPPVVPPPMPDLPPPIPFAPQLPVGIW